MLDSLRKHTKLIIWTVVASFALFGVVSFGTSLGENETRYAGKAFGKPVTYQEFNRFYKAAQIFSYSEESETAPDPDLIHHKAWQNLIYARAAQKRNIKVTDEEVLTDLTRLLKAQGFENPVPSLYERWVQSNFRIQPKEFEDMLRDTLRIQKLVQAVTNAPVEIPSDEEVREMYQFDHEKLAAEAVIFQDKEEADEFADQAASTNRWDDLITELDYDKVAIEEDTLNNISRSWQIPMKSLEALFELETGAVSRPLLFQGKIAVFRLLSKKTADAANLSSEELDAYRESAYGQKKREAFVNWHLQLLAESNLEDYIMASRAKN